MKGMKTERKWEMACYVVGYGLVQNPEKETHLDHETH